MTNVARVFAAAVAVLAAWFLTQPDPSQRAAPAPPASGLTNERNAEFRPFHGLAIQLHGAAEAMPRFMDMIDQIADVGADSVQLVTHAWQTHAGTVDLHIDPAHNPSMEDLGRLIDHAHARRLRVVVMPVVLLSDPRGTEWRGQINPTAGWDEWFRRYTKYITSCANVAERHHVELLMIGSELVKAEQYTDRWRQLIAEVRQFYRGKLGYSANWDHYSTDKIGFWPWLDCVGMTSYYTLADGPRPTLDEVMARWKPIRLRILEFYEHVGKPLVFTEVGWCSQEGAASESWNYYHNQKATPAGLEEQATCYRAFIQTWENTPQLGGTLWWEWTADPGGPKDFNYTPKGKPAEKLLRDWFARLHGKGTASKPGDVTPKRR